MAAFSRGFTAFVHGRTCFQLPRSFPVSAVQYRAHILCPLENTRFFSVSTWKYAKAKKLSKAAIARKAFAPRPQDAMETQNLSNAPLSTPTTVQRPPPKGASTAASTTFVGQPVHRVALLGEPTLLYKAPSQRLYVFVSLASFAILFACGLWMYKYIYLEVRDLHWYTGFAYFAMVVMLVALALNYGLASRGLVKSITAVPVQRNRQPRLDLRIEIQRLVPILKNRILEVPVEKVSQPVQGTLQLLVIDVAYRKELYRLAKLGPKNEPMLIKPFTRLGRFLSRNALRFFQYNQAVAGGLGFSPLYVKGERFQLKIDGSGWFLEDGKVLDQIVRSSR